MKKKPAKAKRQKLAMSFSTKWLVIAATTIVLTYLSMPLVGMRTTMTFQDIDCETQIASDGGECPSMTATTGFPFVYAAVSDNPEDAYEYFSMPRLVLDGMVWAGMAFLLTLAVAKVAAKKQQV